MVIKKRQILWDWTNTGGAGHPGVPDKINQVPFDKNSPVASVVNWNAWVPPELKDRVPFRPMVRVLENTKGNDWAIIQNSKYPIILFFNEPERAGISPEQARDIWYGQMLPLRKNKGKKLGSPAVASDDKGRAWIEKFMSLVSNDMPDFLCLHYYSNNADGAIKYIEDMHKKWPKQKVMVTEIACIDRNYRTVLDFTAKVCNWMDGQDWIFEYGLFDFQRTPADSFVSPAAQLMDKNGNLTELGNMYVHQQPMKVPANHALNLMALAAPSAVEGNGEQQQIGIADGAAGDGGETNDEHVSAQTGTAVCQEPNEETFFQAAAAVGEVAIPAVHVASALGADQQKALDLQNNKRKGKGLKPLVWDGQLAKNAEEYAKHLVAIGKLQHSTGDERPNQGENLAWASASNTPLAMAANMWLDEEKNYHGEPIGEGNFGSYGHYTQCMWKSTTKVGLGSAKDAKGGVYIVGRYSPPGNWTGQKPY